MDENIISLIAKERNISISQVKNTLELLEEGATVPFIARYRKEYKRFGRRTNSCHSRKLCVSSEFS